MSSSDEQPPLIQCALAGDTGGVDAALERGEDADSVEDGRTALMYAAADGQLDVVKLLLYRKADPNRRSRREEDNGGTPLHLAAEGGHVGVVEELMEARANPEAFDARGRRPVHRAAIKGQKGVLEVLKRYSCNMEARDTSKATPLHFASYFGDLDTVAWLVEEARVNTQLKDKNGRLPKDVAKRYKNHEVHQYLKDGGAQKKKGSMFGGPSARRSTRDSRQRQSRDITRQRPESPAASSGPESITVTQSQQRGSLQRGSQQRASQRRGRQQHRPVSAHVSADLPDAEPVSLASSTLAQSLKEVRASDPSLSASDTPPQHSVERRSRSHDPRRPRTWSLRSSRGKSLKHQVEDLADIRAQQEDELEFKNEEITKLKDHLSHLEHEKSRVEEEVSELRLHVEQQQKTLTETAEVQQQIQALTEQHEEYKNSLAEALRREAELRELDRVAKQTINTLVEREELNQQSIDALTKEVERLCIEVKAKEERLNQSQEALRVATASAAEAAKAAALKDEVDHLTFMLNQTGQRAIASQEKLEQKIADMKAEEDSNKITITTLTDRLREAEEKASSDKDQEARIQTLMEKDIDNQLTIASLNAKIQELARTLSEKDHTTLTYHKQQQSKIEELTENDDRHRNTIAVLSEDVEQLNRRLKESQDSVAWYQDQLQQKEKEKEQKEREKEQQERASQQTISTLRAEVDRLKQQLEEMQQKVPLTQYERGGTMVALQKREAASRQTIKALETQLEHLNKKFSDAEQASLSVQRQQLDTINNLKKQLEDARNRGSPQNEKVEELMKLDLSNKLVIEALNKKIDQLSADLKRNYDNFTSWQTQQQEKDREHAQREAESQQTIAALREELAGLQQAGGGKQDNGSSQQVGQKWGGLSQNSNYTAQYNHFSSNMQPRVYSPKPFRTNTNDAAQQYGSDPLQNNPMDASRWVQGQGGVPATAAVITPPQQPYSPQHP